MTNMEKFDEQLDKFIRHQMSAEEEQLFISELEDKPELMERAQTIALAISEIQNVTSEKEQEILQEVKKLDEEEYKEVVWESPRQERFKERISAFMRKEMTEEEVTAFQEELLNHILELERTQVASAAAFVSPSDETPTISLWKKVARVAMAACMVSIVALGGYKYNQYNQTVRLGSECEVFMISEYNTRGGEYDNVERHLSVLFARVNDKEKNLDEVISELLDAYNSAKKDIENPRTRIIYSKRDFDKRYRSRRYKQRIPETIREYSSYGNYLVDISWNLSVAYLLNGDKDSPVKYLEELVENNEGKAIAQQAQDLLDKIRKL